MIIVFDAQCLLCNGWVRFLLRRRGGQHIRFASMQGETGRRLLLQAGLDVNQLQTLLVVDDQGVWQHTTAITRVLSSLGWPWNLARVGYLVPEQLRDTAYRWVARNRYRLFGRSEQCALPDPGEATRFLD